MATAVCRLRWRGACIRRIRLIRLIFNDEGAPRYTPRVCCAAVWLGSGQIYRWGMQGLFDGNGGVRVAGTPSFFSPEYYPTGIPGDS